MLSKEELEKLSHLSKIRLSEAEKGDFCQKLRSTMDMIENLGEVDTKGVEPLNSVIDASARFRADEVSETNIDAELFSNAPSGTDKMAKEIKFFVVPKMVE